MRDRLLIHKGIRQRKLQNLSRWQILISNSPNKNLQRVHFLPIQQRDVQNCDQVPQVSFSCLATFRNQGNAFIFHGIAVFVIEFVPMRSAGWDRRSSDSQALSQPRVWQGTCAGNHRNGEHETGWRDEVHCTRRLSRGWNITQSINLLVTWSIRGWRCLDAVLFVTNGKSLAAKQAIRISWPGVCV